ncbi:MAG: hypothetical protein KKA79_08680 [Nanoarchaeota archaeon]|nr:hypothetical protein [Nanoarchaeota archaeon]
MENGKRLGLVALCLLALAVIVLASEECPTEEEYRGMLDAAIEDYFTDPNPDKLMELEVMLRIYATHDFSQCLEEGFIPEEGGSFEVDQPEIDVSISLIVEADKVLAQKAMDFAKSLTVIDPDNQDEFDDEILSSEDDFAEAESFALAGEFDAAVNSFNLAWEHAQNAIEIANEPIPGELGCSIVSGSCDDVSVFKIAGLTNTHAQLEGSYSYTVCCDGVSGLGTESDGEAVLGFSRSDNAHVQKSSIGTYLYLAYLSAPGGISCDYVESSGDGYSVCGNAGFDTCLASIQSEDNSHVGDCSAYDIKVCCKAE